MKTNVNKRVYRRQPSGPFTENSEADLLNRVRYVDRLSSNDIVDIASGQILAVRINGWFEPKVGELVVRRAIEGDIDRINRYQEAGIKFYGFPPFFDSNGNPVQRERYFETAGQHSDVLRDLFQPYACPTDVLRSTLDEIWPGGANLMTLRGRKMSPAVLRVFEDGGDALPHQDDISLDAPDEPEAKMFECTLTALTYLKVAEVGGQVELWNERYGCGEYDDRRLRNTYGLDREFIPEPELVITPRAGEMIIFNASKVHAVRPVSSGVRATISSFIGFSGLLNQLKTWQ